MTFDEIVCTGVLHHLANPEAALRALRDVLDPDGAMHLMVYAPYGRAGIYMLQEFCRRIGIRASDDEIRDLVVALGALPAGHPLARLLREAPDFRQEAALADALLHPQDRAYSVPQLLDFISGAGLTFSRWVRQAPYSPHCGLMARLPQASRIAALEPAQQYAAAELFRGAMMSHSVIVRRDDRPGRSHAISFSGDAWLDYVPVRVPDTLCVQERLPPGAAAVLINRAHTDTDIYLPIDAREKRLVDAIDGERSIGEIAGDEPRDVCRALFERLWWHDQVVFDASRGDQLHLRCREDRDEMSMQQLRHPHASVEHRLHRVQPRVEVDDGRPVVFVASPGPAAAFPGGDAGRHARGRSWPHSSGWMRGVPPRSPCSPWRSPRCRRSCRDREVKAGGLQPYAVSLLATLALLAIVTIPLSVELLAAYYGNPLTTPASAIARLAFISVLLPLAAGIAVRAWTTVAERLVRPASQLGTLLLVTGSVLLLSGTWRGIWGAIGDGTLVMVVAFVAIGLVVGRLLGGPDPRQATVLGLSTACRHPAITLSIASANFPDERFGATVMLYLLVGLVLVTPYVMWSRARIAAGEDSRKPAV